MIIPTHPHAAMPEPSTRRILLCVPNIGKRPNNTHRLFTLGLLYLQRACMRAGWQCILMDAYFDNLSRQETVARIAELGDLDIIGFTLNDDAMLHEAEAICDQLPKIPTVIAGGVYASRMAEQILAGTRHFHHVFQGEAEDTLEHFLNNWNQPIAWSKGIVSRGAEGIVKHGPKALQKDTLDRFGDWRFADLPQSLSPDEYSLVTSRGCTARCNYCVIGPHWSRYGMWRGHSAEWILEKLLELRDLGATHVNIVDDQFVGSPESIQRAYQLASLLRRHEFSIPFVIMSRAVTVVEEPGLFAELRDVGLRSVFLGLESGNNHVLTHLRKDTTAEQGCAAVQILADAGIGISSGTILFHPWTTLATLQTDIAYFRALLDKHSWFEFYGLNELDLLNGTPISKMWSSDASKWHADWRCLEPEADEVYRGWLDAQRRFLFPFLERLGPTRARDMRRTTCRWMLDALSSLLDARLAGDFSTAFLTISLSTQLLTMRAALAPMEEKKMDERYDNAETVGERCFE